MGSSSSGAKCSLIFLYFSGLLISGLYIESGPTVQNILVVHISVGGLVGLGFGLMYLPAMDIVPHYFDHRCLIKALSREAEHSTNFLLQTWTGDWHCCSRLWCRPGSLIKSYNMFCSMIDYFRKYKLSPIDSPVGNWQLPVLPAKILLRPSGCSGTCTSPGDEESRPWHHSPLPRSTCCLCSCFRPPLQAAWGLG